MNNIGTKTLETDNLILRKFKLEDIKGLYENWASDKNISTYLGWKPHKDIEETEKSVKKWIKGYEGENVYKWVIIEKSTNSPIGSIGAETVSLKHKNCDIGYSIGSKWWNKGYTTEALKNVLEFLLLEEELVLVEAKYNSKNIASGRTMEKAGMKKDGVLRKRRLDENTGELSDLVIYSIIKEDLVK